MTAQNDTSASRRALLVSAGIGGFAAWMLPSALAAAGVAGPLVINRRTDVVLVPGKPNVNYEIAGVFLVKDGKIREWVDYNAT